MKNFFRTFFPALIVGVVISLFSSCQSNGKKEMTKNQDHSSMAGMESEKKAPPSKQEKKQVYHCPMHPSYTSDKPGDCPICGMKLVPIESEDHDAGVTTIKISPEKQQLIGVKTAVVEVKPFHKSIATFGKVTYIDKNVALVNAKFEGWVEKLYIDSTGQIVKRGDPLVGIYSPDLVSTQKEYLLALKSKSENDSSGSMLLDSAKWRFKLWDISDEQVKELETTGEPKKVMTLNSPITGFVIEKNVLSGQKIGPGETLYKIADLSRIWVEGEIYEADLPLVKIGQHVSISLTYYPGETFDGKVAYIYPYLDPNTRTNKIRIESENREGKIKPDMFAGIDLHIESGSKLSVPAEAVLDSGGKKIVFVDKGNGYFEPREITVGISSDDFYEVLSGVKEGEKVVSSANFLIDSESKLKAAMEQMGKPAGGHEGHQR